MIRSGRSSSHLAKTWRLVCASALIIGGVIFGTSGSIAHAATTWYVSPTGQDTNSCLTPTQSCQHIQTAINQAAAGDVINVAAGIYTETLSISRSVMLVGAGAGINGTVIDANLGGTAITVSGAPVTISKVVIQHGSTSGIGGGINNTGILTILNSSIISNTASSGAGIANIGILTINNSQVRSNSATGVSATQSNGGGLYNSGGQVHIANSTIANNTSLLSVIGESAWGGAIVNSNGGTIALNQSVLASNRSGSGGAIENNAGTTITISGTVLNGNSAYNSGGAMENLGGMATIVGSSFSNNTARNGGGAINNTAQLSVAGTSIMSNTAGYGGAINSSGTLTLTTTLIQGNSATGLHQSKSSGGGLQNNGGSAAISNCTFSANTSLSPIYGEGAFGGAITNLNTGVLTVTNSLLTSNKSGSGGGIENATHGHLSLIASTLTNNNAYNSGGGLENLGGAVSIMSSTLSNNSAANNGGGLTEDSGTTMAIIGSSVYSNTANQGGGVNNNGALQITNSTISGNQAGQLGGGIANSTTNQLILASSTVSNNTAANGGGLNNASTAASAVVAGTILAANLATSLDNDCTGALTTNGYNLLGNNMGCTGLTDGISGDQVGTPQNPLDPGLGSLQPNGGPTVTQALLSGSPAINAGNPAGCVSASGSLLTTDQRGDPRYSSGDTRCDIGAYELQVSPQ